MCSLWHKILSPIWWLSIKHILKEWMAQKYTFKGFRIPLGMKRYAQWKRKVICNTVSGKCKVSKEDSRYCETSEKEFSFPFKVVKCFPEEVELDSPQWGVMRRSGWQRLLGVYKMNSSSIWTRQLDSFSPTLLQLDRQHDWVLANRMWIECGQK